MPNTPTLVGKGMAAISGGTHATESDIDFVTNFLASSGEVIVLDEELQDAVTATSGSGPAYFFYFVEEMIKGAIALGLSEAAATKLTIQTITGAAAMLNESGKSPTTLRENVTSPKGTTAAALETFYQANTGEIISAALKAARDRSQELA
jgi:pyrroline-5-carboxylate reductase